MGGAGTAFAPQVVANEASEHAAYREHVTYMPRESSDARSFIKKGTFVNQGREHGRDHDVVNRACEYKR